MNVTALLYMLMLMMSYCQTLWNMYEAIRRHVPFKHLSIFLFQHMLLSIKGCLAATNDPHLSFCSINCRIRMTFMYLITCFDASLCAPDIKGKSVLFVRSLMKKKGWFILNGALNQPASNSAFKEMIPQETVSQNLIWMDYVESGKWISFRVLIVSIWTHGLI